ncbi:MAG: sensor histidine kinase, partial [Myxococcota bacterium]
VETRAVTIPEFLNGLATPLSPFLKRQRCKLAVEVEGKRPLLVAAGELDQVITNLVVNACRHGYGEPGSGTEVRLISLRARLDVDNLHVEVEDHGSGMDPEVLARVYEPFYSTRKGQGGTGLGMHIVHQLVTERFGGEITAVSALQKGTCWRLRLPLGTNALRDVPTRSPVVGGHHVLAAE